MVLNATALSILYKNYYYLDYSTLQNQYQDSFSFISDKYSHLLFNNTLLFLNLSLISIFIDI